MNDFNCMTKIFILLLFNMAVQASDYQGEELKQQLNQFLSDFQNRSADVGQLDQLEVSSHQLLKQLQNCESQAEEDLRQLTEIREIGVLKNTAKDSQNVGEDVLADTTATAEVDRQIVTTTQLLITCRLKSNQVGQARLTLINQRQHLWLNELTQRQDVWSFLSATHQPPTSAVELSQVIPISDTFIGFAAAALLYYVIMLWLHRNASSNLQLSQVAEVSLKDTGLLLLKLHVLPMVLAGVYFFNATDNPWHLLVLTGGLLLRDCCAFLSIQVLASEDKIKSYWRFIWSSSLLLVVIAFGLNGIHFQDNNQTELLVNYSYLFTPLILVFGVLLALTNWWFYQLLENYKDRLIPLLGLVTASVSTLAFILSYAYGSQYLLLLSTGVLLLHWFLKIINGVRKILLRKKIDQLKLNEGYAGATFTFPFWVSLFVALGAGLIGMVFLGWLAGVTEEAFKQISFVFTEGFDVGSVRLVPQDILIGLLIITILSMLLSALKQGIQNKWFNKSRLRKSSREVFSMVVWYLGITLAVFIGLSVAGFDISNLAIIAGALSVGIGFGLQNIVSNFVSGLILLFERPITRGDWVEVGGTVGLIEKVKIRATRIRTFDNAEIMVPNSELLSHHVTNWTLSNSIGRITLKVGVAYGSDINKVREILNDIALNHEQVIKEAPYKHKVLFRQFGDSSLNFELRVMIKEIKMFLEVETDLNFAIDKGLREAQITIPFPQRDLHIKDGSVLHVESKSDSAPNDDHSNDQKQADEDSSVDASHQQDAGAENSDPSNLNDTDKDEVEKMIEEDEKRKKAEQQEQQASGQKSSDD